MLAIAPLDGLDANSRNTLLGRGGDLRRRPVVEIMNRQRVAKMVDLSLSAARQDGGK